MEKEIEISQNEQAPTLQDKVIELEKRVLALERQLNLNYQKPAPIVKAKEINSPSLVETSKILETITGASQLGWLAIIVFITGFAFLVKMFFNQNWISGIGQPVTLGLMAIAIFIISDILIKKSYKKFGSVFAMVGYLLIFLTLLWPVHYQQSHNYYFVVAGAFVIWIFSNIMGVIRKTSLWPQGGLAVAGILPIMVINQDITNILYLLPVLVIMVLAVIFSTIRHCKWMAITGSIVGILVLVSSIRLLREWPEKDILLFKLILFLVPIIIIFWSVIIHSYHMRKPMKVESLLWIFNNALLYIIIIAMWKKLNQPSILLIPVIANGLSFATASFLNPDLSDYNYLYLSGFVLALALCMTFLLPIPLDIIVLCLFTLLLAFQGSKRINWHLKALSGAMVIWCIIFLFAARISLSASDEMAFFNLRFASFAITFLCFGFQGRLINDDPNAGMFGPILGQGLFSLGLLVLLGGISSEIIYLFPAPGKVKVSQNALLGLTFIFALFSFAVIYLGLFLRLLFIRILGLGIFALLLTKLFWLDIAILEPVFLLISFLVVGLLLAAASILLKKTKT